MLTYYPININLQQFKCLIVGAGKVGLRKAKTLVKFKPCQLTLIDPNPQLPKSLLAQPFVQVLTKRFEPKDLNGYDLIFACTNDPACNSQIVQLAQEKKQLINTATNPKEGNFILPSVLPKGDLTVTVFSQGTCPALSKYLRQELELIIGPEYQIMAQLLKLIRPVLIQNQNKTQNNNLLNTLVQTLMPILKKQNKREARQKIKQILPPATWEKVEVKIDEVLS